MQTVAKNTILATFHIRPVLLALARLWLFVLARKIPRMQALSGMLGSFNDAGRLALLGAQACGRSTSLRTPLCLTIPSLFRSQLALYI
jgi:hypothetical protein